MFGKTRACNTRYTIFRAHHIPASSEDVQVRRQGTETPSLWMPYLRRGDVARREDSQGAGSPKLGSGNEAYQGMGSGRPYGEREREGRL